MADPAPTTIMQKLAAALPPNRIVTLFGPFLAIIAGALASWIGSNFPELGLDPSTTAGAITQGLEFGVGAVVTLALHYKWLDGWQKSQAALGLMAPGMTQTMAASPPIGAVAPDPTAIAPAAAPTTMHQLAPTTPAGPGKPSDG